MSFVVREYTTCGLRVELSYFLFADPSYSTVYFWKLQLPLGNGFQKVFPPSSSVHVVSESEQITPDFKWILSIFILIVA